jgi:hypothetical protein
LQALHTRAALEAIIRQQQSQSHPPRTLQPTPHSASPAVPALPPSLSPSAPPLPPVQDHRPPAKSPRTRSKKIQVPPPPRHPSSSPPLAAAVEAREERGGEGWEGLEGELRGYAPGDAFIISADLPWSARV